MNLARFSRVRLGHLSTPIEPMPNLSKALGGPRLWIKRDDCNVGDGQGMPTKGMVDAVRRLGHLEGILLDPVYSGKALAGLIDLIRRRHFKADSDVIFSHTGGSAALFGYPDALDLSGYVD
jgi:L-cysteate sulfo-lyase